MIDFRAILQTLARHQVAYVVIGGAAMVLQGSAYMTEDLDVLYQRSPENCRRLGEALSELAARLRVEGIPQGLKAPLDGQALRNGLNFTLTTQHGDFDILGEVPGVGRFEDAQGSTEECDILEEGSVKVLSLRGLIAAKRAAGRPKDIAAIPELEAMLAIREAQQR